MKEKSVNPHPGRPRSFDRGVALQAALDVFWRHGFEQTTMAQLTAAMGIASPSIYCAFGNKSSLFLEALKYYQQTHWDPVYDKFRENPDIYSATRELFEDTARCLLAPNAPSGCLIVMGAMNLPEGELELRQAISDRRGELGQMFRQKLKEAISNGQIPPESDIPAISGALQNFLEGLSIQARGDICLSELLSISALGIRLLPDKR